MQVLTMPRRWIRSSTTRLDIGEADALAARWRPKGHSLDKVRGVLHVIQLGDAARRRGEPLVLRDIGDALAIYKDLPIVPQP